MSPVRKSRLPEYRLAGGRAFRDRDPYQAAHRRFRQPVSGSRFQAGQAGICGWTCDRDSSGASDRDSSGASVLSEPTGGEPQGLHLGLGLDFQDGGWEVGEHACQESGILLRENVLVQTDGVPDEDLPVFFHDLVTEKQAALAGDLEPFGVGDVLDDLLQNEGHFLKALQLHPARRAGPGLPVEDEALQILLPDMPLGKIRVVWSDLFFGGVYSDRALKFHWVLPPAENLKIQ
jgi:hypothetical protein